MSNDPKSDVPVDGSGRADEEVVARRSAMKKAAAGAAAAGALWAAPRVEGLSLVPDFAEAATFTGSSPVVNFDIKVGVGVSPGSNPTWNAPWNTARTVTQSVTSPTLGTLGSVSVTIPPNTEGNQTSPVPGQVSFSGWDPPFNRISGGNLVFKGRNPTLLGGRNGPHGPLPITPWFAPGTFPAPTATPISFNIPQAVNDVGPSPVANTQWGDLSFTFNFTGI